MRRTRWLKSTNATPRTSGSLVGVINKDSGRAFLDDVDANDEIETASSLLGGVGGYVKGLISLVSSSRTEGAPEEFGVPWRIRRANASKLSSVNGSEALYELEIEPELRVAKDWRGSLVTEFRLEFDGDEREIERCEAVSASSSSDSLEGVEFLTLLVMVVVVTKTP
jgi:hypothetical protein